MPSIERDKRDLGPSDPGHQDLDVVYFKLFDNCNAKCNMCDCWERPRATAHLDHYKDILSKILVSNPRSLRFTGGEPLMFRELPQLIAMTAEAGVMVSVMTNGRLLRSRIRQLADSGCREVVLSLDATAEKHNLIRKTPQLFEMSLAGIEMLRETSMTYGVNTVVQRLGIRELPRLAEELLRQERVPAWWHLIPVRDHPALSPSAEDLAWFCAALPAVRQEMTRHGVQVIGDAGLFTAGEGRECAVPEFALYVDAEAGQVYGCNMLAYTDPPLGDLTRDSLAAIRAGLRSVEVRSECATSSHAACVRCDSSSQRMNYWLRQRAVGNSTQGVS
jgi:MoaA/NifB/PqqE/SkfB family radical SAM enzyme